MSEKFRVGPGRLSCWAEGGELMIRLHSEQGEMVIGLTPDLARDFAAAIEENIEELQAVAKKPAPAPAGGQ